MTSISSSGKKPRIDFKEEERERDWHLRGRGRFTYEGKTALNQSPEKDSKSNQTNAVSPGNTMTAVRNYLLFNVRERKNRGGEGELPTSI